MSNPGRWSEPMDERNPPMASEPNMARNPGRKSDGRRGRGFESCPRYQIEVTDANRTDYFLGNISTMWVSLRGYNYSFLAERA